MSKPRLLDLYCGAGGCTKGYQLAGFHVTGVDINPQPRYCGDAFVQADALEYVAKYGYLFAAISASPPCQGYSKTQRITGKKHPLLIEQTRNILQSSRKPYVIENVPGAPLRNPITLTGTMFGLRTVRPRLFECSFALPSLAVPTFQGSHAKMGRKPLLGEYVHVVGHVTDIAYCRQAMDIDWMNRAELTQAIPPAYTCHIGRYLMEILK